MGYNQLVSETPPLSHKIVWPESKHLTDIFKVEFMLCVFESFLKFLNVLDNNSKVQKFRNFIQNWGKFCILKEQS